MSDTQRQAVTADRKEYYHQYYLKRRDELLARSKQRNLIKSDPIRALPRGRQPGTTFPDGYKKKDACPAGALRSPPAEDKYYD